MALTWIEIDKNNLVHNLQQYKNIIPQAKIWPVIKSNAYGHGWPEIVEILDQDKNATGFMVANLSEALLVRSRTKKPIMVLSYFDQEEEDLVAAADQNISLPLYDLATADYLEKLGERRNKKFLVNIKVDTGASRLGLRVEETSPFIQALKDKVHLEIFSIFTHFAESESADQSFTKHQLLELHKIKEQFPDLRFHCACSAAVSSVVDSHLDLVRLGLGLYGLWPSQPTKDRGQKLGLELRPVLSWRTQLIQIKKIKKGESVGYNRTHVFDHDGTIAVLPIGYNEGYDRSLSNKGAALIKGYLCPVRGNICMNLTMVEIPPGLEVEVGEVATLIGADANKSITAEWLASQAQTINYEIITRINPLLSRRLV